MIAACNQIESTAPTLDWDDFAISEVKSINEDDLIELSVFLGEVFKDVEARRELFDFAEIEGNDEDIEYSLKTLFQNQTNPVKRTRSAIVNAFHKTAENLRMEGQLELSVDKLIQFINDNDIGILAPYLYDNFDPSDITELTVSWYLEEEEIRMLEQDPDWEGETKGLKLRMDENGTFDYSYKLGAVEL